MKPFIERSNSCIHQQNLINQYEEFRIFALKKVDFSSHAPLGFSILLLRGMAVWAETLSSEFEHPYQETSPYFQAQKSNSFEQYSHIKRYGLLHTVRKEATIILTNMVMCQQKEIAKEKTSHA